MLRLHVWPVTQILHEIADGTCDFLVFVECEGYDWNEANGDPRPSRNAMRGPIPTIMTLRSNPLIPFELLREIVRAEGDAECHG